MGLLTSPPGLSGAERGSSCDKFFDTIILSNLKIGHAK